MSKYSNSSSPEEESGSDSEYTYRRHGARPGPRRNSRTQRLESWQNNHEDRFGAFDASRHYFTSASAQAPRYAPSSAGPSMYAAPSSYYPSTTSNRPPSLAESRSSYVSSVRTSRADSIPNQYILDEDEYGTAQVPIAQLSWPCPFVFLGCQEQFHDSSQWDTHAMSHFRTSRGVALPRSMRCPFEHCSWYTVAPSGQEAWQQKRIHVAHYHPLGGRVKARADTDLAVYLWNIRAISSSQEQELRRNGQLSRPTSSEVQTMSNSSTRRDPRRERRPRDDRSPRGANGASGVPMGRRYY